MGAIDFSIQYFFFRLGCGVANRGVSFGFNVPTYLWYLAFGLILMVGYRSRLFITGAVGNLLSRMILGYVWDYIKIPYVGLWFNLSDVMIVSGAGLMIWKSK